MRLVALVALAACGGSGVAAPVLAPAPHRAVVVTRARTSTLSDRDLARRVEALDRLHAKLLAIARKPSRLEAPVSESRGTRRSASR